MSLKTTKERATKQLRIYPETYEVLRRIGFRERMSLGAVVNMIANYYEGQ